MENLWSFLVAKDHELFFLINNFLGEVPGLQYLLGWPTFFGEAYLLLPFVALFLWTWDRQRWWKVFLVVLAAFLISTAIVQLIKIPLNRQRPYGRFFQDYLMGNKIIYVYFQRLLTRSFPSGHTTTITAVTVSINLIYRHRVWWLYSGILWIALTRIYVGAHFPSDVLAGIPIGIGGAFFAYSAARRLKLI